MKIPILEDTFSDRGLNYKCLMLSKFAAMYECVFGEEDEFVSIDVFRLNEVKPVEGNPYCLYPPDDAFIFSSFVDSYSGEMQDKKDLLDEAIMKFKEFGYITSP